MNKIPFRQNNTVCGWTFGYSASLDSNDTSMLLRIQRSILFLCVPSCLFWSVGFISSTSGHISFFSFFILLPILLYVLHSFYAVRLSRDSTAIRTKGHVLMESTLRLQQEEIPITLRAITLYYAYLPLAICPGRWNWAGAFFRIWYGFCALVFSSPTVFP